MINQVQLLIVDKQQNSPRPNLRSVRYVHKYCVCVIVGKRNGRMRNTKCVVRELSLMQEMPRIARTNCGFDSLLPQRFRRILGFSISWLTVLNAILLCIIHLSDDTIKFEILLSLEINH